MLFSAILSLPLRMGKLRRKKKEELHSKTIIGLAKHKMRCLKNSAWLKEQEPVLCFFHPEDELRKFFKEQNFSITSLTCAYGDCGDLVI